jgi:hypothetical protein
LNLGLSLPIFLYLTYLSIAEKNIDFMDRIMGCLYNLTGLCMSLTWFLEPSLFDEASTLFGLLTICMTWLRW